MQKLEFIDKSIQKHGIIYGYSLVPESLRALDTVSIECPIHGIFHQRASHHYSGLGCRKCSDKKQTFSTNEFIQKAISIHGNKYNYSKVDYVHSMTKVQIECPLHGIWFQTPAMHLQGKGCKKCNWQGGYCESWFAVKERRNRTGFLYLIKMNNDKESFYKLGITNRRVQDRIRGFPHYEKEMVLFAKGTLYQMYTIEQYILRNLIPQNKKYRPLNIKDGGTECFIDDGSIVTKIADYIARGDHFIVNDK